MAFTRNIRITRHGIRMHDIDLTLVDDKNRSIEVGPASGLLARDAGGTIIHDIPDAPVLTNIAYLGHLHGYALGASVVSANGTTASSTLTYLTASYQWSHTFTSGDFGDVGNVNGAVLILKNYPGSSAKWQKGAVVRWSFAIYKDSGYSNVITESTRIAYIPYSSSSIGDGMVAPYYSVVWLPLSVLDNGETAYFKMLTGANYLTSSSASITFTTYIYLAGFYV